MKKLLSCLAALCVLALPLAAAESVAAKTYTDGFFTYTLGERGAAVYMCVDPAEALTVPETLAGQPVIELGEYSFTYCRNMKTLDVPGTLEAIGARAFAACPALETVRIAEGVKSIGAGAFMRCEALKRVYLPASVESIGEDAFEKDANLTLFVSVGSYAARYADENGLSWVDADYEPVSIDRRSDLRYKVMTGELTVDGLTAEELTAALDDLSIGATVEKGGKGENARAVQLILVALGAQIEPDGIFGAKSVEALKTTLANSGIPTAEAVDVTLIYELLDAVDRASAVTE